MNMTPHETHFCFWIPCMFWQSDSAILNLADATKLIMPVTGYPWCRNIIQIRLLSSHLLILHNETPEQGVFSG